MEPILEKMERKMKAEAGVGTGAKVDVELPCFVDGMYTDVVVWEGGCNIQRNEVADESKLPIGRILAYQEKQKQEQCRPEVCHVARRYFR